MIKTRVLGLISVRDDDGLIHFWRHWFGIDETVTEHYQIGVGSVRSYPPHMRNMLRLQRLVDSGRVVKQNSDVSVQYIPTKG